MSDFDDLECVDLGGPGDEGGVSKSSDVGTDLDRPGSNERLHRVPQLESSPKRLSINGGSEARRTSLLDLDDDDEPVQRRGSTYIQSGRSTTRASLTSPMSATSPKSAREQPESGRRLSQKSSPVVYNISDDGQPQDTTIKRATRRSVSIHPICSDDAAQEPLSPGNGLTNRSKPDPSPDEAAALSILQKHVNHESPRASVNGGRQRKTMSKKFKKKKGGVDKEVTWCVLFWVVWLSVAGFLLYLKVTVQ